VKTNIGHAEAASGIAGLIKAVLCLEHRLIPPSLHHDEPSPRVPWDRLPLVIARRLEPWPEEFSPAYAGVNSFGVTGTNAHVVLEEAPRREPARPHGEPACAETRLLPLSAKTPEALRALADRWVTCLDADGAVAGVRELCFTAGVRRTQHSQRLAVVGGTRAELADRLGAFVRGESRSGVVLGRASDTRPRVVFVFPGQGSQWLGMGRALLATEPVFAEALERCERALAPHVTWSLLDELSAESGRSQLERIDVVQPVLFAIQVALATLWRAWGVEPDAVVGHSMGEVAAAHVAGALSLEDAARVIATRSRLLRAIAGRGAMAMVELSLDDARTALAGREDRLSIAVSNGARSTVLSGDTAALDEVLAGLERRGVFCRRVKVDVASHSPHVDVLRADLLAELEGIAPRAAQVRLYSTVTGALESGAELDPAYWVRNLREPVLFAAALTRLVTDGCDAFIEISSHPVLVNAVEDTVRQAGLDPALVLRSGRREDDERAVMLESFATLWTRGYPVDWSRPFPGDHTVVSAPTYPWQRERFWYESGRTSVARPTPGDHPLLATHVAVAAEPGVHLWEGAIAPGEQACVARAGEHLTWSTACLGAVLTAARRLGPGPWSLDDLRFPEVPRVGTDGLTVQLEFRPGHAGGIVFRALGRAPADSAWAALATGSLTARSADQAPACDVTALKVGMATIDPPAPGVSRADGHEHGLSELWLRRGAGLARIAPATLDEHCALHPATLGAALHWLAAVLADDAEAARAWRPVRARALRVHDGGARPTWIHAARIDSQSSDHPGGDVRVLDEAGRPLVEIEGVEFAPPPPLPVEDVLYEVQWLARPRGPRAGERRATRWVLLGASPDTVVALAARLREHGQQAVVLGPSRDEGEVARRLGEVLASEGDAVGGVVHLGSLDADAAESPTSSRAATAGWASALATVHTLARLGETSSPRLWIVTRGAQSVGASDGPASLGGAALWGLGAVIAHEHPSLRCARIDLSPGIADLAAVADELLGDGDEDRIALRDGQRYVARLVRAVPAAVASAGVSIAGDGTYLISGGLGGLGLMVARWLVGRGARHLALVGRREPSTEALAVLAELRAAGAEVTVLRGDVARRDDVERVLAALPGPTALRGIVHAAGVLDPGILVNLDAPRVVSVMKPKVEGALNLAGATRDRALDFVVFFSSVSASLGVPGEGNYAAANAALEAVAARLRAEGRPVLSIAWGPWSEVGMVATRGDGGRRLAARGLGRLTPEEGLRVLEHTIATRRASALAMRFDPARWSVAYASGAHCLLDELATTAPGVDAPDGIAAQVRMAPPGARRERLQTWLREQVGQVLRIGPDRVEPSQPLKTMGLDSLLSLELRNRLEAAFAISLPATAIWNYPTVVALAGHLETRLGLATPVEAVAESAGDVAIEHLLAEIEQLSEEDVRRLLTEGDTA
jgi:myxalamid-type polyketide synthase MxaD